LPRACAGEFPEEGSHLERFAQRLSGVEINSSFYRPHRVTTYERWARVTPEGFRFAVKAPKEITHVRRLRGVEEPLERFLDEVGGLGEKLGVLLIQLPPSLKFERKVAEDFFRTLREWTSTAVVCEPRHVTWFSTEGERLLRDLAVSRAAADPSVVPAAALPGGAAETAYFRWHGSPRMYWSAYDTPAITDLARRVRTAAATAGRTWCIFDNTAAGAAIENALALNEQLAACGLEAD
jgi:uncharacterized protein YecE (DUF72 family)